MKKELIAKITQTVACQFPTVGNRPSKFAFGVPVQKVVEAVAALIEKDRTSAKRRKAGRKDDADRVASCFEHHGRIQ